MAIGQQSVLMETQLVLATVAQRYQLYLVPGNPLEPEALLSLHLKNDLPMTLQCALQHSPIREPFIGGSDQSRHIDVMHIFRCHTISSPVGCSYVMQHSPGM
jgi:hypothetical protein